MTATRQRPRSPQPEPPSNTITNTHKGTRCRRCKRILRTDASVQRGCGWRCARHLRDQAVA